MLANKSVIKLVSSDSNMIAIVAGTDKCLLCRAVDANYLTNTRELLVVTDQLTAFNSTSNTSVLLAGIDACC